MVGITSFMPNLGGLTAGMGKVRGGAGVKARKTLTENINLLNMGGSITCAANAFTVIGSYTVRPQTSMRWGFGTEGKPNSTVGAIYGTLTLGGSPDHVDSGIVRLSVRDSEGRVKGYTMINGTHLAAINTSFANNDTRHVLPENGPLAVEDDQLIVEFNPLGTARNLSGSGYSTLQIDSTLIS